MKVTAAGLKNWKLPIKDISKGKLSTGFLMSSVSDLPPDCGRPAVLTTVLSAAAIIRVWMIVWLLKWTG